MAFELLSTNPEEFIPNYDATTRAPAHALEGQSISEFAQMVGVDPQILLLHAERAGLTVIIRDEADSVRRLLLNQRWTEIDRQLRPEAYAPFPSEPQQNEFNKRIHDEVARRRMLETDPRVP